MIEKLRKEFQSFEIEHPTIRCLPKITEDVTGYEITSGHNTEIDETKWGPRQDLKKLVMRLKHGVKSELLDVVKLPGIGRVRARKLYDANITAANIGKTDLERLASLVGQKTAEKLLNKISDAKSDEN